MVERPPKYRARGYEARGVRVICSIPLAGAPDLACAIPTPAFSPLQIDLEARPNRRAAANYSPKWLFLRPAKDGPRELLNEDGSERNVGVLLSVPVT